MRHLLFLLFIASGTLAADDNTPDFDKDGGFKFTGKVESLPTGGLVGNWTVSGRTVRVSAGTKVEADQAPLVLGACVEVRGMMAGSLIDATKIETVRAGQCGATPSPLVFFGNIQALPSAPSLIGDWKVSGRVVHVTLMTKLVQITGPIALGGCVEVHGTANPDGSITATEIDTKSSAAGCASAPGVTRVEVDFKGVIQTLPPGSALTGTWTVSGRQVLVSASTVLVPRGLHFVVGACVEVRGMLRSDGSVDASKIEAESCVVRDDDEPKFLGIVRSLPPLLIGDWKVGTRTVRVTAATRIRMDRGVIQAGSCVEVRGQLLAIDLILAARIDGERMAACQREALQQGHFELAGTLQAVPASGRIGDWKVGTRTVRADANTVFDTSHGPLVVGACVEVKGILQMDGALLATRIETKSSSGACVVRNGVVAAGSMISTGVSPGEIVTVFGIRIGPATPLSLQLETPNRVSTRLGNTRVLFDGVPAPLLFASSGQINAVVPFSVAGRNSTTVQVETDGTWSNPLTVPVQAAAPSVFTLSGSGEGQGAILNFSARDGFTVNGPSNPSDRNSVVVLFATGEGLSHLPRADGLVVDPFAELPRPLLPVEVTIGGKRAMVEFAGAAPGFVSGVLQVNARLPADLAPGSSLPVLITVGGQPSQDGVTMAVR